MAHEWGGLGSLAHTQFPLPLPLLALYHLLLLSRLALTWALLLPSVHSGAWLPVHRRAEGLS